MSEGVGWAPDVLLDLGWLAAALPGLLPASLLPPVHQKSPHTRDAPQPRPCASRWHPETQTETHHTVQRVSGRAGMPRDPECYKMFTAGPTPNHAQGPALCTPMQ